MGRMGGYLEESVSKSSRHVSGEGLPGGGTACVKPVCQEGPRCWACGWGCGVCVTCSFACYPECGPYPSAPTTLRPRTQAPAS